MDPDSFISIMFCVFNTTYTGSRLSRNPQGLPECLPESKNDPPKLSLKECRTVPPNSSKDSLHDPKCQVHACVRPSLMCLKYLESFEENLSHVIKRSLICWCMGKGTWEWLLCGTRTLAMDPSGVVCHNLWSSQHNLDFFECSTELKNLCLYKL